jgi:hypothetical protein
MSEGIHYHYPRIELVVFDLEGLEGIWSVIHIWINQKVSHHIDKE